MSCCEKSKKVLQKSKLWSKQEKKNKSRFHQKYFTYRHNRGVEQVSIAHSKYTLFSLCKEEKLSTFDCLWVYPLFLLPRPRQSEKSFSHKSLLKTRHFLSGAHQQVMIMQMDIGLFEEEQLTYISLTTNTRKNYESIKLWIVQSQNNVD